MIYKTKGVCSQAIEVEVDGDTVKSVQFVGGCNGNTKGIAQLVAGMKVDDVIARLIRVRLIDDEAYAQSAVRYCASRLMGHRGAVMELKRKGVDRQLAQRVCDEAESQGVFAEAAWELGRRTARKTAGLDVEVRKRRFWSAGGRKGHNPEVLREIAQELFV